MDNQEKQRVLQERLDELDGRIRSACRERNELLADPAKCDMEQLDDISSRLGHLEGMRRQMAEALDTMVAQAEAEEEEARLDAVEAAFEASAAVGRDRVRIAHDIDGLIEKVGAKFAELHAQDALMRKPLRDAGIGAKDMPTLNGNSGADAVNDFLQHAGVFLLGVKTRNRGRYGDSFAAGVERENDLFIGRIRAAWVTTRRCRMVPRRNWGTDE